MAAIEPIIARQRAGRPPNRRAVARIEHRRATESLRTEKKTGGDTHDMRIPRPLHTRVCKRAISAA
ncbi:hypothetical protein DF157_23725 [Burkholderia cenocepacia]|nr:hypothetical protein DF157_23725 [Burkholderia cenocepacia]